MQLKYHKVYLAMLMLMSATGFTCCKDDEQGYTMGNQEFVIQVSSSNNFEIAAGGLAAGKAENAAVRHYGEHMVTDHTAAATELSSLISRKGWTVPDALQQKEQQNLNKLISLSGAAFDKGFADIMVQSHQDAIALYETGAAPMGVADADLRTMASAKLPTLKAHLQEATELKTGLAP